MTLGTLIRTTRKKLGWSVFRLSKMTDLGITHITRIEKGKPCMFDTAMRLLQALGVEQVTPRKMAIGKVK